MFTKLKITTLVLFFFILVACGDSAEEALLSKVIETSKQATSKAVSSVIEKDKLLSHSSVELDAVNVSKVENIIPEGVVQESQIVAVEEEIKRNVQVVSDQRDDTTSTVLFSNEASSENHQIKDEVILEKTK